MSSSRMGSGQRPTISLGVIGSVRDHGSGFRQFGGTCLTHYPTGVGLAPDHQNGCGRLGAIYVTEVTPNSIPVGECTSDVHSHTEARSAPDPDSGCRPQGGTFLT